MGYFNTSAAVRAQPLAGNFSSVTDPFGHGDIADRLFCQYAVLPTGVRISDSLSDEKETFIKARFEKTFLANLVLESIWVSQRVADFKTIVSRLALDAVEGFNTLERLSLIESQLPSVTAVGMFFQHFQINNFSWDPETVSRALKKVCEDMGVKYPVLGTVVQPSPVAPTAPAMSAQIGITNSVDIVFQRPIAVQELTTTMVPTPAPAVEDPQASKPSEADVISDKIKAAAKFVENYLEELKVVCGSSDTDNSPFDDAQIQNLAAACVALAGDQDIETVVKKEMDNYILIQMAKEKGLKNPETFASLVLQAMSFKDMVTDKEGSYAVLRGVLSKDIDELNKFFGKSDGAISQIDNAVVSVESAARVVAASNNRRRR